MSSSSPPKTSPLASNPNAVPQQTAEALVDDTQAAPRGEPCPSCGCPAEPGDHFCAACGTPFTLASAVKETSQVVAAGAAPPIAAAVVEQRPLEAELIGDEPPTAEEQAKKHFRCETCGAEVTTDPTQLSYVCPFCDSTYVVEFARDLSTRQRPEFVIGFAIEREQARDLFRKWLHDNHWLRPGDLAKEARIEDKLAGVYIPFWTFSMRARSKWRSRIGIYWYRTETYTTTDSKGRTVTKTRRVRETEWWPLAGDHHHYYSGFMVSGSKGLPQDEAERIKPFQLPALKRYQPFYLAGWLSEDYSIDREAALKLCQQEFYRREQANVAGFQPGDTHRDLHVETWFDQVNSDLCLLPVYILRYRYKDKLYRFLINGQTGRLAGDKPLSGTRVGILVGVIVAAILGVALLVWLASGG